MIEVKARQLQPGDFGYDEIVPMFAVTVTFKDEAGNVVFVGGNSLVAAATEVDAITYGENVITPDLLTNYPRRLAAFKAEPAQDLPTEPVAEPTPEGV